MSVDYSVFAGSYIKVHENSSEWHKATESDSKWDDELTWVHAENLGISGNPDWFILVPNAFSVGEIRVDFRQDLGEFEFSQQEVENEMFAWIDSSGFSHFLDRYFPNKWEVKSGILSTAS